MKCDKKDLLLYAVTDRHWLEGRKLIDVVKESLDGGVTMVQLREKTLEEGKFLEEARELQALCRERHIPFIVNDNVDIAKAMDVCRLEPSDTASHLGPVRSCAGGTAQTLAECPYFSTEKLRVEEALVLEAGEDSFISLLCVKGGGRLEGPENALEFTAGDSLFVPAGTGRVRVCGEAELVKTTVPAQGE